MERYSETISDELKDKVLRIQAQTVSDFKSCAFEIMDGMDEDTTVCRWVRAQKDEETNNWIVKEYKTAPYHIQDSGTRATDLNKVPAQQRTLMHRACLMDALNACASFETYERSKGKFPSGPEKEELGIKHYQLAGEEEGIPFDLNSGLPVPAANGIILSEDSELPALSEEFEEKSKGNLVAKADMPSLSVQDILGRKIDIPQTSFSGENTVIAKNIVSSAQELTALHHKRMKNLGNLSDTFNHAYYHKFKKFDLELENPVMALTQLPALVTVPLAFLVHPLIIGPSVIAGIGYIVSVSVDEAPNPVEFFQNNGLRFPMHKFNKQLNRLRENIDALDNDAQKDEFHQIIDKMKLAAYAIRAKNSFNKAAEKGGWLNKYRMNRDLTTLEKIALSLGMPQGDINALFNELKRDDFKGSIDAQYQQGLCAIRDGFAEHIAGQQKRLSLK